MEHKSPENFELAASELHPETAGYFKEKMPFVSIIIPAYNEAKVIRDKIENCLWLSCQRSKLEIIIASDGSDDRTVEIANEYKPHGVKVIDYKERTGKTILVNRTVPKANGEIIILSDASSLLSIDSIQILVRHFFNNEIGCVSGTYKLIDKDDSGRSAGEGAYWKYEAMLKANESKVNSILGAHGAIYAFRKELFQPAPPQAINDDYIIPMQIVQQGYKVIYEKDAIGIEIAETDLKHEFKRRIRIMAGNFQQIYLLKGLLNPFRSHIAFQFFSHKFMRLLAPFLQIVVFVVNLLLFSFHPFYRFTLFAQVLFYVASLMGYLLANKKRKIKLLYIPFYFNFGNLAAFAGLYRYIAGQQSAKWEKVDI
ncbi:glycosyltransferase family 2 protein [candidate division KSB1 bacterium]|nr:glycosyltransferase family 2 protein [candidate division KSB1 bacterium]